MKTAIFVESQIYAKKSLRIYRCNTDLVFSAVDIGHILCIENWGSKFENLSDHRRIIAKVADEKGANMRMNFLTLDGMHFIINKLCAHEAKLFAAWIFEQIIPEILRTEIPIFNEDINDYIGKKCLYLLHLNDDYFKFGISKDVKRRMGRHRNTIGKMESVSLKIVNIWDCQSMDVASEVENKLKTQAREVLKILDQTKKYGRNVEILKTRDIKNVIGLINKYVQDEITIEDEKYRKKFAASSVEKNTTKSKSKNTTKNVSPKIQEPEIIIISSESSYCSTLSDSNDSTYADSTDSDSGEIQEIIDHMNGLRIIPMSREERVKKWIQSHPIKTGEGLKDYHTRYLQNTKCTTRYITFIKYTDH